jgi:general secretion pathway protein B
MSILLDALKKSEEQRQLGKAPTIHTPSAEHGDSRAGAQQWMPLTLIAVSAIVLAWIGWQQYRLPAAPDSVAEAPAGTPVEPQVESRTGPQNGPQTETARAAAANRLAANDSRRPGDEDGLGGGQEEAPPDALPPEALRTPVERFRPATKALRNVTVMPPDPQAEGQPVAQASPAADTGAAESEAADEAAGQAAGEARPRQSRAEPHLSEPISFWELPQGIRDSLPELHVSVLVYALRPEDRFVLVSGHRLAEKDEYEGGVVLEEIRRDGAVFQYRNYRFLVKG